ncbi:helix-turn-helix domain-containing protein [Fibrobacter sp. UWEL]|uniref:helix-turn-helix domain-containing protein n=1 Tax=Fibrobacter sp. UWEL TaxID=1896209 RepID=UPI001160D891|nr:helix-turn-helix domain-containing protein [Fibrobacter sp. UWEL]
MYKKHTNEEWAEALELYKSGHSPHLISQKTGITERLVLYRCREYDLTGEWYRGRKQNVRSTPSLKRAVIDTAIQQSLSLTEIAVKYQLSRYCLQSWLRKYRHGGYEELLATKPKGRPPKMPKKKKSAKGMTELERLQEENAYLKAENAYLKKLKALDQEENAEMFGIGPRQSED